MNTNCFSHADSAGAQAPLTMSADHRQLRIAPEEGGFPLVGRPYAAWRRHAAEPFAEATAEDFCVRYQDGALLTITAATGPLDLQITVRLDSEGAVLSGRIQNTAAHGVEIARVHYLHGALAAPEAGLLATTGLDCARLVKRDQPVGSRLSRTAEAYACSNVIRQELVDPIHNAENWCVAEDCGVLTEAWDQPGWFLGAVGPGTAFGEIGIRTCQIDLPFFAGVRLEGIRLDPGEVRTLERLRLCFGNWQDGIRTWARDCAVVLGARPLPHPPVGYCSWYQRGHGVTASDLQAAVKQFAKEPIPLGNRLIQLDDGFQKMPGDWRPNERFEAAWEDLPHDIAATGSLPGLWLAPSLLHETHPAATEHPDWIMKTPEGTPATSWANWGWATDPQWGGLRQADSSRTVFLDVDHTDVRTFMRTIVREAVEQGWKYLKLDFTNRIGTARTNTANRTSFESYRAMVQLFRESAGDEVVLNACIGCPGRFALGFADAARLGGDIGANWNTVQKNLRPLLLNIHTNGLWWSADPDVWFMRDDACNLDKDERFLLTATIGMMGGLFLTSDLPEQWPDDLRDDVRWFWNERGPRVPQRHDVVFDADGTIRAYAVTQEDGEIWVGLYNWADAARNLELDVRSLLGEGQYAAAQVIGRSTDSGHMHLDAARLQSRSQPRHSLRIAVLRKTAE